VETLRGRRPLSVDYWDIHNVGQEPARWDDGDWHHAVMGVQLTTEAGPVTVTWTNTFHPYGVEVFHEPIELHLVLGEDGPERVGPGGEGPGCHSWRRRFEAPLSRGNASRSVRLG